MSYEVTKNRVLQWIGIMLVMAVFAGAYWYFQVFAGYKTNSSQTGTLTSGLVGIWSFDGADISGTTAYDRSGSGNNGTLTNGPAVVQGKVGQALEFDGSNDRVAIASSGAALNLTMTLSWSAWIYPQTFGGNGLGRIIDKNTGNSGVFFVDNSNITNGLGFAGNGGAILASSKNNAIATNTWQHVVVTFSSGTVSFYVNGVLNNSTATAMTLASDTTAFAIGERSSGAGDRGFDGFIDEVRVYNRVLSAGEIQAQYAAGQSDEVNSGASQAGGGSQFDSGLAGYWKLDDGSGTSATDASTNGNTGTLTNGPTWTTGQIGSALSFDGTDDNISIGNISMYDGRDDFTITAWINLNSTSGFQCIFCKDQSGDGASQFRFSIGENGTGKLGYGDSSHSLGGNSTLSTSTWYHAVITRSSGAGYTFYLNGIFDGNTAPGSPPNTNSRSAYIGARESNLGGLTSYFNGKIDEVRFYHRSLSADEVSQLYRLTTPTGVDTGLKGYWSFNGKDISSTTAYDRSGVGTIGTLTNSPVVTPGTIGQALNFDGVDDYVQLASNTALDIDDNFTISAWVRPESFATLAGIVGKYHSVSGDYFLRFNGASPYNKIEFGGSSSITSNTALVTGQWYHIVAERSSGTGYIYINGVLDTSGSVSIGSSASNDVTIGLDYLPSPRYFKGKIDEVRIYNRVLTSGEIQSLYKSGQSDEVNSGASQAQGGSRLDSGLSGYWKMDDGSGTSATDASTNGNTGTLTNGPTWGTGQIVGAVTFDGINDEITTTTDQGTGAQIKVFTLSSWFKTSTASGAKIIGLEDSQTGTGTTTWDRQIWMGTDGKIRFGVYNGYIEAVSTATLNDNTWHHAVGVSTGDNGTIALYVDGVLQQTTNIGGSIFAGYSASYWRIGGYKNSPGWTNGANGYFTGSLDEVRVYNRSLSSDEVSQLYRLSTPTGTDTSLKGYWPFNGKDVSGTTTYDRSGVGNAGTLTNGPSVTPGKVGQALEFDGANDYVSISDTDDSKYTGSLTLCTWAKIDTGGAYRHFMGKHSSNGVTQNPFDFRTDDAATPKLTLVRANTTNIGWEGPTVTLGQWKYYCVVAPALIQSAPTFYIDGVATTGTIASGAGTGAATGSGAPIVIGVRPDNAVIMDGAMDEVRIYNRELTSNEITALYNSGR